MTNGKQNDMYPHMQAAAAEAARIARGVDPALAMTTPTHCGEWDLGALINHWVLYSSHGLEHRALRKQLPEELTKRDFAADPGWAEAYANQLERAVAAWADPAVWKGKIDTGYVESDATEIASMVIKELAVHGWDVARATGQRQRLPESTGAFVLGVVSEYAELYRQYDGFAEPVPVPEDAPAMERALGLSGRDPGAV
ncbi:TIGR03086 family metal-binding protein [Streptomyces boninensis]|uniref:TIGR03086 family metal-binding protein n=1 Tax=Streptomyces boninensis TaxID=2039455 RepID=UPI003B212319